MEVDPRRDHSIRIPRPDLSMALGTPNACTRCHLSDAKISDEKRGTLRQYRDWIDAARGGDQEIASELARIDKWMLESMQTWYKKETWGNSFAYALAGGTAAYRGCGSRLGESGGRSQVAGDCASDGDSPARLAGCRSAACSRKCRRWATRIRRSAKRRSVVSTSTFRPWPAGPLSRQEEQQLSEQVAPAAPATGAAVGRSAAECPCGNRTRAGPAARTTGRGAAQRKPA